MRPLRKAKWMLGLCVFTVLCAAKWTQSYADKPRRTTYVVIDPVRDLEWGAPLGTAISNIIYLNRCVGGCVITPGKNNAQENRSTVFGETVQLSEFGLGDDKWLELLACVKDVYSPYNVRVTDEDPGGEIHHEAVVAGSAEEAGVDENVGGLAPLAGDCSAINNVMSFSFANSGSQVIRDICWTVVQESAHAFGLDHVFSCNDPMTYIPGCGIKYFRDQSLPCGELEERPCKCSGSHQNSHCRLVELFGPGENELGMPEVTVRLPYDGDVVQPGFHFYADASDPRRISRVEILINGSRIGWVKGHDFSDLDDPYHYAMPNKLPRGKLLVEARAINDIGGQASASIVVNNGNDCVNSDDCGDNMSCREGGCFYPEPDREFGVSCSAHRQCKSGYCMGPGSKAICTQHCTSGIPHCDFCPRGFECQNGLHGAGYCAVPEPEEEGCSCSSGQPVQGFLWVLIIFAVIPIRWTRIQRR